VRVEVVVGQDLSPAAFIPEALQTSDIGSLSGSLAKKADALGNSLSAASRPPATKMREVSPMCPVQSVINVAAYFFEVPVRRLLRRCCTTIFPMMVLGSLPLRADGMDGPLRTSRPFIFPVPSSPANAVMPWILQRLCSVGACTARRSSVCVHATKKS
jgi:hypothetical protein